MPAPLLHADAIPGLAEQLDLAMIKALRRASVVDYVPNDSTVDQDTADAYGRLTALHCVEVGQCGSATLHWIITQNGVRALQHLRVETAEDDDAPPDTSGTWLQS